MRINIQDLNSIVKYVVSEGEKVNKKYIDEKVGAVDYVAIFSESEEEKEELLKLLNEIGEEIQKTPTGPNFKLNKPILTKSGPVNLVKIRNVDPLKKQRGAPDFRVDDYDLFKKKYIERENINLIERVGFEMIEIWDPKANVLVYFCNIPITEQLKS